MHLTLAILRQRQRDKERKTNEKRPRQRDGDRETKKERRRKTDRLGDEDRKKDTKLSKKRDKKERRDTERQTKNMDREMSYYPLLFNKSKRESRVTPVAHTHTYIFVSSLAPVNSCKTCMQYQHQSTPVNSKMFTTHKYTTIESYYISLLEVAKSL